MLCRTSPGDCAGMLLNFGDSNVSLCSHGHGRSKEFKRDMNQDLGVAKNRAHAIQQLLLLFQCLKARAPESAKLILAKTLVAENQQHPTHPSGQRPRAGSTKPNPAVQPHSGVVSGHRCAYSLASQRGQLRRGEQSPFPRSKIKQWPLTTEVGDK